MNVENVHSSDHSPVSQIATIFYAFCPVLFLLLLWTVLLGPHQDLWLCDLLSDGWHQQPLNEVVEALAPNIFVRFLSLLHHGTSLHDTLSTCQQWPRATINGYQIYYQTVPGSRNIWKSRHCWWIVSLQSLSSAVWYQRKPKSKYARSCSLGWCLTDSGVVLKINLQGPVSTRPF